MIDSIHALFALLCIQAVSSFYPSGRQTAGRSLNVFEKIQTFPATTSDQNDWEPALCKRRRDFFTKILPSAVMASAGSTVAGGTATNAAPAAESSVGLEALVDLPMIRLRLPQGGLGRDYVAMPLKIKGQGPFEFMLDSGLTTEFITPHLQQVLGIGTGGASRIEGLAAGGATRSLLVELQGASLIAKNGEDLKLPTLHAVITHFPQEHIDPAHDPVEGMLGMEMLSMFDADFDFKAGRIRLYEPGSTSKLLKSGTSNLAEIPAVVINETGLIGIRLAAPGMSQPVLAFLDCGSTFSALNWQAAELLGLPGKGDPLYKKTNKISAIGIDGKIMELPVVPKQFTFLGETLRGTAGELTGFAQPPPGWKPWNTVQVAVGDLPAFKSVLGDGVRPFTGPAALIGLDVLSQRRVIFETAKSGRQRRVLVSIA